MVFEFKNLGAIREATIEMGKLTVICGKNNTGKTYLTYAVWGLLQPQRSFPLFDENEQKAILEEIASEGNKEFDNEDLKQRIEKNFTKGFDKFLPKIFDVETEFFSKTLVDVKFEENDISLFGVDKEDTILSRSENPTKFSYSFEKKAKKVNVYAGRSVSKYIWERFRRFLLRENLPYTFLITAQRDSIHLFRNAINSNARYELRDREGDERSVRYAMPLEENIDFSSSLADLSQDTSFLQKLGLIEEIEKMLGIKYQVFYDSFAVQNEQHTPTPAFMASTSVRTLADLHFYLKHTAQKGDLLMIDEPELNLHPENQIKVARLLVKLVNAGIKVWITTHSDYIVKELNNCLMLSREFAGKEALMQELGYKADETISPEDLRMYIADNGTVEQVGYDEYGMLKSSFDEAMRQQDYHASSISNKITQSL